MATETLSQEKRDELQAELTELQKLDGMDTQQAKRAAEINDVLGGKTEAKSTRKASGKAKGNGGRKRAEYPEEITNAVARVSEIAPDAKTGHPGPRQHTNVRKAIVKKLGGEGKVTAAAVLKLSGVKSEKLLKEIAARKADRSELTPLREMAKECGINDAWEKGRHLASILTVYIEQLKKDGKK